MCNQNRFLILMDKEHSCDGECKTHNKPNKPNKSIEKQIILPDPGFQVCMNKKTRKALKNGDIKLKTEGQLRTDAFETLGNKELIYQRLQNTEMCIYAVQGKKCPRKICYFAHSSDELQIVKCFFGISCRYINDKTKPCKFLHPIETIEEYINRIKQIDITSKDDVKVLHS